MARTHSDLRTTSPTLRRAFSFSLVLLTLATAIFCLWSHLGRIESKGMKGPMDSSKARTMKPSSAQMIVGLLTLPKKSRLTQNAPTHAEIMAKVGLEGQLQRTGLALSSTQLQKLEDDFLDFLAVRSEIEKNLLKVESFDGNTLQVEIPAYPEEGLALRQAFLSRISADFPGDLGGQIQDCAGEYFDISFRGYGITDQHIALTKTTDPDTSFRLVTTVTTLDNLTPSRLTSDRWQASSHWDFYTQPGDFSPSGFYGALDDLVASKEWR